MSDMIPPPSVTETATEDVWVCDKHKTSACGWEDDWLSPMPPGMPPKCHMLCGYTGSLVSPVPNVRQIMADYERLVAEARTVVSIMCDCEHRYDTLEDYDLPTLQWCEAEFSPAVLIVHWMDESHIEDFGASPERKDIPAHFLFSRDWVNAYRVEAQEKQAREELEAADREIERLKASLTHMEAYRETLKNGEVQDGQ